MENPTTLLFKVVYKNGILTVGQESGKESFEKGV